MQIEPPLTILPGYLEPSRNNCLIIYTIVLVAIAAITVGILVILTCKGFQLGLNNWRTVGELGGVWFITLGVCAFVLGVTCCIAIFRINQNEALYQRKAPI